MPGDGSCHFAALVVSAELQGICLGPDSPAELRKQVCKARWGRASSGCAARLYDVHLRQELAEHLDFYYGFIVGDVVEYLESMEKDGALGDNLTLQAFCNKFAVRTLSRICCVSSVAFVRNIICHECLHLSCCGLPRRFGESPWAHGADAAVGRACSHVVRVLVVNKKSTIVALCCFSMNARRFPSACPGTKSRKSWRATRRQLFR